MVSEIINDWLEEGFSDVDGICKIHIRSESTLIPCVTNDVGENITPRPLFPIFIEDETLDADFLPKYLMVIENHFCHEEKKSKQRLTESENKEMRFDENAIKNELVKQGKFTSLIEYARKNIFLSRVISPLFEMPDSKVSTGSSHYQTVLKRNQKYLEAVQNRQNFPIRYQDQIIQAGFVNLTDKHEETLPIILTDKHAMVNSFLMKEYYDRDEVGVKTSSLTFEEFVASRTKFRDYKEFLTDLEKYPSVLNRLKTALYVTEKTLNYNSYKNTILAYNGCITELEDVGTTVENERIAIEVEKNTSNIGSRKSIDVKCSTYMKETKIIKHHLRFSLPEMKNDYEVTCINFNPLNPCIFVGGYGVCRRKEMDNHPRGMILCWNIHKCGYPEIIYPMEEVVTCIEFSNSKPYLVAVGMRYGLIVVLDIRKSKSYFVANNSISKVRPSGTIKSVRWMRKKYSLGKESEVLLSVSTDGVVSCWNYERDLDGYILRHIKRGENDDGSNKKMTLASDAVGQCLDIKPDNHENYLIGTFEGQALLADINDSDKYIKVFNCHKGPIYDLQWSPVVEDVFLTCGTDRRVRIWESYRLTPSKTLNLSEVIMKIAWSNIKSTLFLAVSKSKVFIFDLFINQHHPIAQLLSDENKTITSVVFCPRNNWFLLGQSEGSIDMHEIVNIPIHNIDEIATLKDVFLPEYEALK
ncbi:WD repeat-containing protein 78-like [Stegodyphus dumicola]|uniref:WD repeat-containing protein 78-like n=1 Tax=Stegodyphus dumicola TaxID=202533 RepID=UPI0015A9BC9C|nr:WD repeat-containing protein 78-like [Stegodyphus dumicola]